MNEQELNEKFRIFEDQIMQLQGELDQIDKAIFDMGSVSSGLEELKGKTGKEIFSPLGQGIYIKSNLSSEEILVDVGKRNFVKKSIDETKELINSQKEKLEKLRKDLESDLKKIDEEVTRTMKDFEDSKNN
jgi:prefoldin alpha subunit